jgi:VIT1/CCC1 family predicted Fe2+/Mn2+ transporter
MWQQWTNGILGLWIILLAFLNLSGTALVWTLAISGIAIAILGFWGGSLEQVEDRQHRHA